MVIGLADDIRAGDSLPLTLSFGDGSTLRIDVPVLNAPPF
jgi:copper(I)-binding protein